MIEMHTFYIISVIAIYELMRRVLIHLLNTGD